MSFFEAAMLLCFGFAWPVNIHKALTSRATGGKSPFFLNVIQLGYVFGIINKFLYSRDIVMVLYFVNLIMVTIDLLLYYRNRNYERMEAEKTAKDEADQVEVER